MRYYRNTERGKEVAVFMKKMSLHELVRNEIISKEFIYGKTDIVYFLIMVKKKERKKDNCSTINLVKLSILELMPKPRLHVKL